MFSGLDTVDIPHSRRWTALTSFVLQGILVSGALVLPLLHPTDLPQAFLRHRIFVPVSAGESQLRPNHDVAQHSGGVHLQSLIVRRGISYLTGQSQVTTEDGSGPPTLLPGAGPGGLLTLPSEEYAQPVLNPPPTTKP